MVFRDVIASLDWVLLTAVILLVLVGFAMLLSAAPAQSLWSSLFLRQAIAAGLGAGMFLVAIKLPYHVWRRYSVGMYVLGVLSLLLVTIVGTVIRGTVSRFELFGFQAQPSEFMKVGLVIILAWMFSPYRRIRWRQIVISSIMVAVPVAVVAAEPDFGVAALMLMMWAGLLVFVGLPWRIIGILSLLGIVVVMGAWNWLLLDYQQQRIVTFLNPEEDPLRAGYNIKQAIIALGSGQMLGRGLGHGPQSQLKFLPERHTDFIVASIGEELGFVGIGLVIVLYATVLWRLLYIAQLTEDRFGQLLTISIFLIFLTSFLVSIGMNMGLLPVTGIPLPLVSYGGSNLVSTLFLVGIAQSVRVYSRFVQRQPPEISGFV